MAGVGGSSCSNCGRGGHFFRECAEPITSLGIIAFRRCGSSSSSGSGKQWLMIRRRDTLGFIEIMRGKYELRDEAGIQSLIDQTTLGERRRLLTGDFAELWRELWNGPASRRYHTEYEQARAKFEVLRGRRGLAAACERSATAWQEAEWGFPKGRRTAGESELACALRETWEEAGVVAEALRVLPGEPLTEQFRGSNGVVYRHRYWVAEAAAETEVGLDPSNMDQQREVGAVRWCGLEEAIELIRPYNAEKRRVLAAAAAAAAAAT